jgi:DNA-binding response OmpR family regulator
MLVLLVEDDADMAAILHQSLTKAGFSVEYAADGRTALRKAVARRFSLIVLDLMLPGIDGLQMCEEFRARRGATPILMITARDSIADRIRGLETGADDYLPKPFDIREFLARARALIRRDQVVRARHLGIGDLKVDTRQRAVTVAGKPIPLTKLEYGILEMLLGQVGRIVLRETLLDLLWQDRDPGSNKLEVAIRSLRRKLEQAGRPQLIQTVYGAGYTIRDEAPTPAS